MSPSHRAPRRLTRRHLLGMAGGLAAVPVVAVAAQQVRSDQSAAEATSSPGRGVPSAAPSAAAAPKVITKGGGSVPFKPGHALLGSYLSLDGRTATQSQALRREQLGRDERIVHVFYDWADSLPTAIDGIPAKAVPLVSWRGTAYDDITSGRSDDRIARAARRLKRQDRPVLLRWGWEMNGDWYAWGAARNGQDPEAYIASWRRLHDIFAEEKARNVSWVWSPNWNSAPIEDWNTYQALYPGDKYVDWVGVSGYNLHRETPDTLFGPIYRAFAARKPIMISEVGSMDRGGRTKADWITLFADWVEAHPAVGGVVWFDTDTHPGYAEKWRIDTDAASLAAYVAMAKRPRFSG
ncbi:glycoside hydrolase family 26 protein [Actinoplanes friuliensis]|uniref:Glycoside hydrolase family protein n=1 Tax=Actinoplanes friuliensis DSM 7358 TaxID=1246995 RepID=U5W2N4_9ACTN|nr:glycosyl hydrolase [Actinoplanes friuliensis]AGZ43272.1 glycoside hydrolase family protein [Actinoplanes friuliensis DSM 7358]